MSAIFTTNLCKKFNIKTKFIRLHVTSLEMFTKVQTLLQSAVKQMVNDNDTALVFTE